MKPLSSSVRVCLVLALSLLLSSPAYADDPATNVQFESPMPLLVFASGGIMLGTTPTSLSLSDKAQSLSFYGDSVPAMAVVVDRAHNQGRTVLITPPRLDGEWIGTMGGDPVSIDFIPRRVTKDWSARVRMNVADSLVGLTGWMESGSRNWRLSDIRYDLNTRQVSCAASLADNDGAMIDRELNITLREDGTLRGVYIAGATGANRGPLEVARAGVHLYRAGHTMIYDSGSNRVVLFGGRGSDDEVTNDVFTLDLGAPRPSWKALKTTGKQPAARELHSACFVESRNEMVVFGGTAPSSGTTLNPAVAMKELGDVWTLSLAPPYAWTQITPADAGPSPRSSHVAVYDAVADRIIVNGGRSGDSVSDETWELALGAVPRWRRLEFEGPHPGPNAGHMGALDTKYRELTMFGGLGGSTLWRLALDGDTWSECDMGKGAELTARIYAAAAFDSTEHAIEAFGGLDLKGQLKDPDLLTVQTEVANPTPGQRVVLCMPRTATNVDRLSNSGSAPIRPAPQERACTGLVVLPGKPRLELGEEQPVLLVHGGRHMGPNDAFLGQVYGDTWLFYERRPAEGGYWVREWRPLGSTRMAEPTAPRWRDLPRSAAEAWVTKLLEAQKAKWDIRDYQWTDFYEELQTPEPNDMVLYFEGHVFMKAEGFIQPELLGFLGFMRFEFVNDHWQTGYGKAWVGGDEVLFEGNFLEVIN